MKKTNIILLLFTGLVLFSCLKEETTTPENPQYFLSEIRPIYFENLDFTATEVVEGIPKFLGDFHQIFIELEQAYQAGEFVEVPDLEYMRLTSMYYSFYLLALTGTYLDGGLTFEEINGGAAEGLFSALPATTENFEQLELEAMMEKAASVGLEASYLNGYNDKTFGFYMAVLQVEARLKRPDRKNDPDIHSRVIDYVATRLVNYQTIPVWNVLMSMVTMTNYEDELNTFDNPNMDKLRFQVNARLIPGFLPDLGGRYPEILGPLYRFDINMKKIEWLLKENPVLTEEQLLFLDDLILILETASGFMEEERPELLNSWPYKYTYDERIYKLDEIKAYRAGTGARPELKQFINSNNFRKAYQCYSCHKPSGL